MRRRSIALLLAGALILVLPSARAFAQRRRWFPGNREDVAVGPQIPYDGRFTFARLEFTTGPGGYYFRGLPAWAHGYPRSDENLTKILNGVTNLAPHLDGTRVVKIDDPALFTLPVVYVTEPGFLEISDAEVRTLRAYLLKGGFLILDDFRGMRDWSNLESVLARVLPGERLIALDVSHPIFHAFFDIKTLDFVQFYDRGSPAFYGVYPGNDVHKPLRLIANYNNDVSEYWEWSDSGYAPIDLSNEAYKLGVNYVVYGLMH